MIWRRGGILLLALLLLTPFGVLRAQEPVGPAEVSAANVEAGNGSLVIDLSLSRPVVVRSFSLTSPDRLVFDIENANLVLTPDSVTSWSSPLDGVSSLTITQFSLQPPIVRILAEVSDTSLKTDTEPGADKIRLAVYRDASPFVQEGPGAPPENLVPTIERFWHEALDDGRDKFTIEFSFGTVLPQVRLESSTVLFLHFPGTDILLPESSPTNFSTNVGGRVVERMRAERVSLDGNLSADIRLTVPDTSRIGYTLNTSKADMLELIVFQETAAPAPIPAPAPIEPSPSPVPGGQIMVLSSNGDVAVPSDAAVHVTKVQFQTIDADTDRFYIYYEGGSLEPRVQRFNYPTRVIFYFPDTAVVLPEGDSDRFQTQVAGALAGELKVFNRVIEDVGAESQFSFYFPGIAQENIGFTLDYATEGELHIDFYRTTAPVNVESPVEVNISVPETPTAPVSEEPAPSVIEETVVAETEESAPTPAAEEPAPSLVEEPVTALPLITLSNGEVTDNTVVFHIVTSEVLARPEWVEYRYPDRLGLKFPISDVRLLDAGQGVLTTYTHIRSIPLIRAIVDERDDNRSTSLVWTLAGNLDEYEPELQWNGADMTVLFHYNPLPAAPEVQPAAQEPAPIVEQTPVAETETQTPQVEETAPAPVEEPAPAVVEEAPQPVVEETPPPVVEEAPKPVIEEPAPAAGAEPEPVETPAEVAAPTPVPEPAPQLPLITLALGESNENSVVFVITTSEPLAMPEWVEFRYPDRLGLRFSLSDVKLLDADPGVYSAYTHVSSIPLVRAMVDDRSETKSITIAWTLDGALEEYSREIDWDGAEMRVMFNRIPVAPPAVPEIAPTPAPVPPEPQGGAVTTEETPEKPADVQVEVQVYGQEKPVEEQAEESEVVVAEVQQEPSPVVVEEVQAEEKPQAEPPAQRPSVEAPPEPFSGTQITGISFERIGTADVIKISTTGGIEGVQVTPLNYPTKLIMTMPSTRLAIPGGDPQRYDESVIGSWVDELGLSARVSPDSSDTTLIAYAHAVASTDELMYDLKTSPNELTLAVFKRGESSPLTEGGGVGAGLQPAGPTPEAPPMGMTGVPELVPMPVLGGGTAQGQPEVNVATAGAGEPKISMKLQDASIRDVLQLIAEQANLNISIGPSVQGTITITLSDIALFDLLDLLGSQLNFTYVVQHGVYIFGRASDLESQFSFMEKWFVSLSYADPDQVRGILVAMGILANNQIQIYRGDYGTTSLNIASPQLIIWGERKDLERAYRVVATLDQAPVMVQVDFQILNTSETDNKNFGVQFHPGTGSYSGGMSLLFSEQPSLNTDLGPLPQGFDRIRSADNIYTISVAINYLLENGYAELMNRSSLTVANNGTGRLFVGESIPYRSTFQVSELGRVTQRIATQQVGLDLTVRPHASPDGYVTMVLQPQNSNLLELTDVGPRTVNQNFTTTIRVKNGEPFVIGGFIRDEKRVKYDRFPFLSELPLLGQLFQNKAVTNTRSELIFVFTPHIIQPTQTPPIVRTTAEMDVPIPFATAGSY